MEYMDQAVLISQDLSFCESFYDCRELIRKLKYRLTYLRKYMERYPRALDKCWVYHSLDTIILPMILQSVKESIQIVNVNMAPSYHLAHIIIESLRLVMHSLYDIGFQRIEYEDWIQKLFEALACPGVTLRWRGMYFFHEEEFLEVPLVNFRPPKNPSELQDVWNGFVQPLGNTSRGKIIRMRLEELRMRRVMSSQMFVQLLNKTHKGNIVFKGIIGDEGYCTPLGIAWAEGSIGERILNGLPQLAKGNLEASREGSVIVEFPLDGVLGMGNAKLFKLGTRKFKKEVGQCILVDKANIRREWWLVHNRSGLYGQPTGLDRMHNIEQIPEDWRDFEWELTYDENGCWTRPEIGFLENLEVPLSVCKVKFINHKCLPQNQSLCNDCTGWENRDDLPVPADFARSNFLEEVHAAEGKTDLNRLETLLREFDLFSDPKDLKNVLRCIAELKSFTGPE